ncbi:MAG: cell division protein ZapA [Betaproteobacteria bacterium]|nr:cell division protein ZapA [Betaproteobacteria bacterium]
MADNAKTIEVSILGRGYRVSCADGEREALMRAVEYLDAKMGEIKNTGKVNGTDRIAVMAALNIAHELLSMKVGTGFDIGDAKRRINSIEAKLDAAIAQQEKLF